MCSFHVLWMIIVCCVVSLHVLSCGRKGRPVKLHLWDVAGSQLHAQPCHHALIGQGAVGVMYVMDVTSRESLQAVDDWDHVLSKVSCCRAGMTYYEAFCSREVFG